MFSPKLLKIQLLIFKYLGLLKYVSIFILAILFKKQFNLILISLLFLADCLLIKFIDEKIIKVAKFMKKN